MLAIFLLISTFSGIALSIPALPGYRTVEQPDGRKIELTQVGDEWEKYYETKEGYTVIRDNEGYWVYAVLSADGKLISSGVKAGEPPPQNLRKHIRPTSGNRYATALRLQSNQKVVSPQGSGMLPVVLIKFPDHSEEFSAQDFQRVFFGTDSTDFSLKQYYEEVSYCKFTIHGEVVGWVIADNNRSYYGQNDTSGKDRYPGDLVYEAAQKADPSIDYSKYDTDGDCKVDVLAVVHSGTGEENTVYGETDDIWSHRWSLTGAQFYGYSNKGAYTSQDTCKADSTRKVLVDDYIIMSEVFKNSSDPGGPVISATGLMAHEYAHALGLPDLYDVDGSSKGVGDWGLMGSGAWNSDGSNPGNRPAHMSAWSKAVLGWVSVGKLSGSGSVSIPPVIDDNTAVFQILSGTPGRSGEYFLIEYRKKVKFDSGLPGEGLLIWHIDESKTTTDNTDNSSECSLDHGDSSCATDHYRVALEQADGNFDLESNNNSGDGGDPFPGTSPNKSFSDSTTPSAKLYGGTSSNVVLTSISITPSGINLNYDVPVITPAPELNTQYRSSVFLLSDSQCGTAPGGGGGGGASGGGGGGCSAAGGPGILIYALIMLVYALRRVMRGSSRM
jgi:M6 family metalloprotease-like protein